MPIDDETETWFAGTLAGAKIGDTVAFDELVRWLERPLLGFIRARRQHDPDDIANEVLLRVFRRIDGFDGNAAQFRAWVFRIAANVIIDEHRRAQRRGHLVLTGSVDDIETSESADVDEIDHAERVEALLSSLTPQQREVLLLRVVAGLSVEETAEVVGRRPGAVRALQHRALGVLRREMAKRA